MPFPALLGPLTAGLTKGIGSLGELAPFLGLDMLFGGGDEGPQELQSFRNPGSNADPIQALEQALAGTYRLGQGLSERRPARLRSSYVQPGPKPVQIPGLPFQIGGGLGTDPAIADPTLLEGQDRGGFKFDPFQSLDSAGIGQMREDMNPQSKRQAKVRSPR